MVWGLRTWGGGLFLPAYRSTECPSIRVLAHIEALSHASDQKFVIYRAKYLHSTRLPLSLRPQRRRGKLATPITHLS